MLNWEIEKINQGILRTGKVIISLGCSFAQASGAYDDELYEQYTFTVSKVTTSPQVANMSGVQRAQILAKYPTVIVNESHPDQLDYYAMTQKNSFVSVLCNEYLNGEYTPINFGISGCGNRATIKNLYFHPQILWDKVVDIIVVYVPSGVERFDFMNDQWPIQRPFVCMWPRPEGEGSKKRLWGAYSTALWSDKFQVMEQLVHAQELTNWCKLRNAKLMVIPGFDNRYNKDYFRQSLRDQIVRDEWIDMVAHNTPTVTDSDNAAYESLLTLFPWDNMVAINGCNTFIDISLNHEGVTKYWPYLGKGSPNNWITPCCHPAAKAHREFAKGLAEIIQSNNAKLA